MYIFFSNLFQIAQLELQRKQTTPPTDEAVLTSEPYMKLMMIFTSIDLISVHAGDLRFHVERYMKSRNNLYRQKIGQEVEKVMKLFT